ncbi:MAG: hypothetical protein SF097_24995 [Acidobacteriota bacterium]|nr:hypothetical protein [Acidobacteriota bacterium]
MTISTAALQPKRRWTRGKIIALSLLVTATALAIYALFIEPNRLVVHRETITLNSWPMELREFKIAAISDIHAGAPHVKLDKIRQLVELTNTQQPDLIAARRFRHSKRAWRQFHRTRSSGR